MDASSSPTICSVLGSQGRRLRPSRMAILPKWQFKDHFLQIQ